MSSSSQQHLWQPALSSLHLLSHPWLSNQSPTAFFRPQGVWCVGFACLQQRPVECCPVRHLSGSFPQGCCARGTIGNAAGEAPRVARACCFPQPRSRPAASCAVWWPRPPAGSALRWFMAPRTLMVVVWRVPTNKG